jgi:hypothetical protein
MDIKIHSGIASRKLSMKEDERYVGCEPTASTPQGIGDVNTFTQLHPANSSSLPPSYN